MQSSDEAQDSGLTLPVLGADELILICSKLCFKDRIALTSCCAALLARSELASSAALWGTLSLGAWQMQLGSPQGDRLCCIAAWLARRRCGLRRLELDFARLPASLGPLLVSAAGSQLTELRLSRVNTIARETSGGPELAALQRMTALRRLAIVDCGLQRLPELPGLALESLAVPHNPSLGGSAWAALGGLQAERLTSLDLAGTGLVRLPSRLIRLTALACLKLASNGGLADTDEFAWAPLASLVRLTHLSIAFCDLQRLPPQLAALSQLAVLDMDYNQSRGPQLGGPSLRDGAEEAWAPLSSLASLQRLHASFCGLAALPAALSSLPGLVELRLGGNVGLGRGSGEAVWGPLQCLDRTLTRLSLHACGLRRLPEGLSALSKLADLVLSDNWGLEGTEGDADVWWPMQGLTQLTIVDVCNCSLKGLPEPLARLPVSAVLW